MRKNRSIFQFSKCKKICFQFIAYFLPISTALAAYNTRFRINGYGTIELGYSVAGIGDVNNDAIPDFIVASENQSKVYIYSGVTGSKIDSVIGLGNIVAGVGKIDGDNVPDFAIGDPFINNTGKVYVYSGASVGSGLSLIYTITGGTDDRLGNAIAGIGDVFGSDGRNEFVIGASYDRFIRLVSGINGSTICDISNQPYPNGFGASVAGRDNIFLGGGTTNSGYAQARLYLSSSCCSSKTYQQGGGWSVGVAGNKLLFGNPAHPDYRGGIWVYPIPNNCPDTNFADTSLFKLVLGTQGGGSELGQWLGFSVAGLGSATDNFIAGSPYADSTGKNQVGKVSVYGGLQNDTIPFYQKEGQNELDRLGYSVAGLGDIDGDGVGDFIAGAVSRTACCQGPGYALVFVSGCPTSKKGDMNNDGNLTPADVVLLQNCVYNGT